MQYQQNKFSIGTIATDKLFLTAQSSFFTSLTGRIKSKYDLGKGIALMPATYSQAQKSGQGYNSVCNVIYADNVIATMHHGKCGNMQKDAKRVLIRFENQLFYAPEYNEVFNDLLQSQMLSLYKPQVQQIDIAFDTNEPLLKKAINIVKAIDNGELLHDDRKNYGKKGGRYTKCEFGDITIYHKSKELRNAEQPKPYISNFYTANGLSPNNVIRVEARFSRDDMREIESSFDISQLPDPNTMRKIFKYKSDKDLLFKIPNGTVNRSRFQKYRLINFDTTPLNIIKPEVPKGSQTSLQTIKICIKNWFILFLKTGSSDILSEIELFANQFHLREWYLQHYQMWTSDYYIPLGGMLAPSSDILNPIELKQQIIY